MTRVVKFMLMVVGFITLITIGGRLAGIAFHPSGSARATQADLDRFNEFMNRKNAWETRCGPIATHPPQATDFVGVAIAKDCQSEGQSLAAEATSNAAYFKYLSLQ